MINSPLIIGLGTVVIDHQVILEKFPEADEKTTIGEDRYQVGGPVPTALSVLSRFHHQTHFIGSWGDDHFGDMIEKDFKESEIHYFKECRDPEIQTGFAHVWIDSSTGSRTISCKRPEKEFQLTDQDRDLLRKASLLHLDGWPEKASVEAAEIVRETGGLIVLDTGSIKPSTTSLIPLVHILNCPKHFPEQLFGYDDPIRAGKKLLTLGPEMVTITAGEKGAHLFSNGSHELIESIPVECRDTTGAGDVFCGGLIYALLQNQKPVDATRFACVTAALKCQNIGNRNALPSIDDILQHLTD